MSNNLAPPDPRRSQKLDAFDRLLTIMDVLRENCPWDKKQTMETLRHLTIEETYELADSIIEKDYHEIKKELGDLILHMVFYSRIAWELGEFDLADVLNEISEKLINRHPHIYGDIVAEDADAVKKNWEKIKLKEKGNRSVLGGVPKALPTMIKAMRIQEKARGVGFDWEHKEQVWQKVEEELGEFKKEFPPLASSTKDDPRKKDRATSEFGDLLFSLINYSRFVDINPEEALERTNKKFIKRFQYLENETIKQGKNLSEMSLEEMDQYWEKAKRL